MDDPTGIPSLAALRATAFFAVDEKPIWVGGN